jgi:hypothetical protein
MDVTSVKLANIVIQSDPILQETQKYYHLSQKETDCCLNLNGLSGAISCVQNATTLKKKKQDFRKKMVSLDLRF